MPAERDSYDVYVGPQGVLRYRLGQSVRVPSGTRYEVTHISADSITIARDREAPIPPPITVTGNTTWQMPPEWSFVSDSAENDIPFNVVPPSRRPKRVMITGSRTWTDEEKIRTALEKLPEGSTVVHGNARGADKIADRVAKELGLEVEVHPANWREEGRSAGVRRNARMINANIDRVLAFWDGESRGTANALHLARDAGIRRQVFYPHGVCVGK